MRINYIAASLNLIATVGLFAATVRAWPQWFAYPAMIFGAINAASFAIQVIVIARHG